MTEIGSHGADRIPADPAESDIVEPDLVEPDLADGGREPAGRGSIITLTTVIALLLATGLTVLGIGAADNAVANYDASSWLFSSGRGEVDRVNGVTARVDTRTKIKDAQNHELVVTQTDRYLILRDLQTGEISALDLTTLQVNAVLPTTPGLGVTVALHGGDAFVIDTVQGQVRQLDPGSLTPTGEPITLPNGIQPGGFDGKGTLWIGVPTEGTVVAITPGAASVNGAAATSPKVVRTVTVANPGHDLVLSTLDDGVAVLDNTDARLLVVRGGAAVSTSAVPVDQPAIMPAHTTGTPVPITIPDDRRVIVVDGTKVSSFTVPGSGSVTAAVSFAGRIYCADAAAGIVYELSPTGKLLSQIKISSAGGALELEVREGRLFINAPDGSAARVVDDKHVVRNVDKYENGVLGGDPPPPPPQTNPPQPVKSAPGKPQSVTATSGDASATISWRKAADNGSAVTKYVIEGAGQTITVGGRERSVQITGLTNATPYKFTIYAVNAVGKGPKATSPEVIPTADVPDPPLSVTATAKPDGTVDVTWPAANGQGRKIILYNVIAIGGGSQPQVAAVTGTSVTIDKTAGLVYGTQYAFAVFAVNDRNAASKQSPTSNTVVPFTAPGPPRNLNVATVTDQRGAIRLTWQTAVDNGRPVEKYVVDAGNGPQDVTGTTVTLTGFPDDTGVQVKVHAVNQAGPGPDATGAARTIGVPTITWTSDSAGLNSITATFTPNNKGGAATCSLTVGSAVASTPCTTTPVTLTVSSGVYPNNSYPYTVAVTTAAGTAADGGHSRASTGVSFTVICPNNVNGYCNGGVYAYTRASQQSTAGPALSVGTVETPICYTTGNQSIDARPWGGRQSDLWMKYADKRFFPWAWSSVSSGDITNLRGCSAGEL